MLVTERYRLAPKKGLIQGRALVIMKGYGHTPPNRGHSEQDGEWSLSVAKGFVEKSFSLRATCDFSHAVKGDLMTTSVLFLGKYVCTQQSPTRLNVRPLYLFSPYADAAHTTTSLRHLS
jgi:hypothetical protein